MKNVIDINLKRLKLIFAISSFQTCNALSSLIPNTDLHMILWDLDKCSLDNCIKALRKVQEKYNLSNIHIMSDSANSYRAMCYTQVSFVELIHILIDTEYIDNDFIAHTITDKKSALRMSQKRGRKGNAVIHTVESFSVDMPEKITIKTYETSVEKKAHIISLGGDKFNG